MNTIVILYEPLDIGAGPEVRITFAHCRPHTDDAGSLHIIREQGRGNVASFADGTWLAVLDGGSVIGAEGGPR